MKIITAGFEFRTRQPKPSKPSLITADYLAFEAQLREFQIAANASREQMEKWAREAREVGE